MLLLLLRVATSVPLCSWLCTACSTASLHVSFTQYPRSHLFYGNIFKAWTFVSLTLGPSFSKHFLRLLPSSHWTFHSSQSSINQIWIPGALTCPKFILEWNQTWLGKSQQTSSKRTSDMIETCSCGPKNGANWVPEVYLFICFLGNQVWHQHDPQWIDDDLNCHYRKQWEVDAIWDNIFGSLLKWYCTVTIFISETTSEYIMHAKTETDTGRQKETDMQQRMHHW